MGKNYQKSAPRGMTRQQVKLGVIGSFVLLAVCLMVVFPTQINKGIDSLNGKTNLGFPRLPDKGFNLGLDLQGGAHLAYQANVDKIPVGDRANSVEGVRDVIERRVRGGLGVAEPLVQTTEVGGDYRVIVELPGITDVNQAIKMIGDTPVLEFKEENKEPTRDLTKEEQKQLADFNLAAEKKAKEALVEAKKGVDFATLAAKYSDDTKSKNNGGDIGFITDQMYPETAAWAKIHKDGEFSQQLIKEVDGWNLVKRLASKDGDKYVTASHLLICYVGAENCDSTQYTKEQALAKIQEIKKTATVGNFPQLIKTNSTEPGAKTSGGELGSFKKGDMVAEFEKVAFEMPVNTISEPVETKFGYHLIFKKGEEIKKEFQIARVLLRTKTSADIVPPASEWKSTGLSGKQLKRAEVTDNSQTGQIQVSLNFDNAGTKLFADITTRNTGKPVAIFLDGSPISIPRVNEPILSGSAVISGSFTLSEAKTLAQRLNSGALPVPVELISQQKVDATLGMDSLNKSLYAGLIGFLAVIVFMILYYRLPGVIAVIALALYSALSLTIFKVIGVTLTLSGIAGFILSVGMAVDANVLIFERLKEELRLKKNLRSSMEESFVRAWPSIRDSNITTLISCVFLIWMGGGFVQGFAVTLAIGVLVSMFTAITVTRALLRFVAPWFKEEGNCMFWGYTKHTEENVKK